MTDIRIVSHHDFPHTVADWLLLPVGDLDTSEELVTLAKVALMTDALADAQDVLPDPDSTDRRGWWGDYEAELIWSAWPIGVKNWLLTRAKISTEGSFEGSTVVRAEEYTRQALQPLIANRYCSYIDVKAERVDVERIDVTATIYRGPVPEIQLQFQDLWGALVAELGKPPKINIPAPLPPGPPPPEPPPEGAITTDYNVYITTLAGEYITIGVLPPPDTAIVTMGGEPITTESDEYITTG